MITCYKRNLNQSLSKIQLSTTMQDLPQQGLTQFVFYEKDMSNKKSRTQKNIQKIQKLKHDMEDPELKKQRHTIRRTQDKNKLKKQLVGLTEEQARAFLDAKKEKKKLAKQKVLKAMKQGQQIYIDCVFQKYMNQKQNKSLAIQTELIMKSIIHMEHPPSIHLCSVGGLVEKQLEKMCYHYWTLQSHKEDIVDVAKITGKKLVYLSPDAPEPLEKVDVDTAYVIGGLVDRTVKKNASLYRARELNIEARHLPIREFMKGRSCLNLDHVVAILNKFQDCNNWKQAFEFGAPKRWKKGQNQFGVKKFEKSQDEQESQSEEEQSDQQKKKQVQQTQPENNEDFSKTREEP